MDLDATLVQACFLLQTRDGLLQSLHVSKDEFGIDGLEVLCRIDSALDMDDVRIGEGAEHLADGVGLADVGEELVAEPGAFAGPFDDARDIDEGHRRRHLPLRAEDLRENGEPRVRYFNDTGVGLDRGEGIVRGEHVVLGESVEEGGLADVGQADDANSEGHDATS